MRYVCACCGQTHEGSPGLGSVAPLYYYWVPETERQARCRLDADTCVVDDEFFFVRGCLVIPILGEAEPFIWGLWVSLSRVNFEHFRDPRPGGPTGPFPGWLSASLKGYPETENLRTRLHRSAEGDRPLIEIEPTDHPLAVEQRSGITLDRAAAILSLYAHGEEELGE